MKILIYDAGRRKELMTGYGIISHQFSNRLRDKGHQVYHYDEQNYPQDINFWLWIRPPHYVKYDQFDTNNINVFYTMHEHDKLPETKKDWPDLLNKCHAVITPTEWNKKVWQDNGVAADIYVAPPGVDTKIFKGNKSYQFSLLSVHEGLGLVGAREHWKENITAYFECFYDNYHNEVSYTIKSWSIDWQGYKTFLDDLIKRKKYQADKLPEINIIDAEMSPLGMNSLYANHWAFLKNTRGEGYCLPALEAVAVGLRVISKPFPAGVYLNDDNTDYFKNYLELTEKLWENWRRYRKWKAYVNSLSWGFATNKLENVLIDIWQKNSK